MPKREIDPSQMLLEHRVLHAATMVQFDALVASLYVARRGFGDAPSALRRPGNHRAVMVELRCAALERIDIGLMHFTETVAATAVRDASGPYLLQFPLNSGSTIEVDGSRISAEFPRGVVISPSCRVTRVSQPGWHLVFAIESPFVRSRMESRAGRQGSGPLVFEPLLSHSALELRRYALLTVEAIDRGFAPRGSTLASTLEQGLVDMLLEVQPHTRVESISLGEDALRSSRVQLVRELVDRRSSESLRLEDLAQAAGCSVRALQEAFSELCGMTPMEFVRRHRLCRAREMLKRGSSDTRVAKIGRSAGYTNLSRFAAEHEEMFGELPSEALRLASRRGR